MKQKSGGIKRLMELTGEHRGLLAVSCILFGVSSASILGPFLYIYFAARELMAVFTGTSLDTQGPIRWGILVLFLGLTGSPFYSDALLCSRIVVSHTEKSLKMVALWHLAKMPVGYFDLNPSGRLRKIIDENSFQTEALIVHQLPDLIGAQVTMAISLIPMLAFDWWVGVPLLLLFGIGFFLQGPLMGKDGMKLMQTYRDSLETMNHEAVEYIRGVPVVKIFGQTMQSVTKFHNVIKSYREFALAYTMLYKKRMVALNSAINSSSLVLVPTVPIIGLMSVDLMGFMQSFLFYLIFSPACTVILNKVMHMTSYKAQAEKSTWRVDMILIAEPQAETPVPKHPKNYDVSFENVVFAYENTDYPTVSYLDFTAEAGATITLIGHSGSGKSTTASLVSRFYDVQEGTVKIGGVDIREIAYADLVKIVAFVFQDPELFKDSLLENIQAGRSMATREKVLWATHMAQCDDILEKSFDGIDTAVGNKDVYLSGSETQRIATVCAVLKDAPIVVLDEATAHADPEGEQQIQQAFKSLVTGKTVIMIVHWLSTVQDADLILVMKNDELMESGTHDALVQQNGEYAKMRTNYTKTIKWHVGSEVKVC